MKSLNLLNSFSWTDYELLDSGNGKRLERFGKYTLVRPDPQIIWQPHLSPEEWEKADAVFERTHEDKGKWNIKTHVPEKWQMNYKDLSFWTKLTPFKHTGVFPEQSAHWDWISDLIFKANRSINVLNLFAYTGIASLVAAKADAKVTHVDASRSTIGWAKENQELSNLSDKPIRWILDDAVKFTEREIKRGVQYDGIIMDPPVYGHGPTGETWQFNKDFPKLLELCKQTLSDQPLFVLVNAYAVSASSIMLQNVLEDFAKDLWGTVESGELVLKEKGSERYLSTGIFARWSK